MHSQPLRTADARQRTWLTLALLADSQELR